ncbi:MAG: ParB N-terminal domain-containing protein [Brasilonema octagenarum HA4186-MV1]|jgi:ParB family chromosome partitioning protein|nr:ParB N-terminal domain-containing protein [Brasilonema octagenarum HA4186-MV1]
MNTLLHLSNSADHNLTSIFSEKDPRVLQPHSRNSSIYGENEDITELVRLIRHSQWVRPLVITKEGTIISGHRRWKAVLELGWKTVPVEVREFPDEITELQTLLLENANRSKTTEQKVREGKAWFEIESKAAKKRMSEGGKKSASGDKGMENFPYLCLSSTKGTTRDRLAQRVGIGSGRTYAKASKVVEFIDQQACLGNLQEAEELRQLLNTKSIDAAYQLFKVTSKTSHSNQTITDSQLSQKTVKSCWNCQHRLESIDNQSIYCNKFGILNLIYKSGEAHGKECTEWRDQNLPQEKSKNQMFTLQLLLPLEWQAKLEETAASLNTNTATWVTSLISASLFSKLEGQNPNQTQPQLTETQKNTTNLANVILHR